MAFFIPENPFGNIVCKILAKIFIHSLEGSLWYSKMYKAWSYTDMFRSKNYKVVLIKCHLLPRLCGVMESIPLPDVMLLSTYDLIREKVIRHAMWLPCIDKWCSPLVITRTVNDLTVHRYDTTVMSHECNVVINHYQVDILLNCPFMWKK